ncbi:hypothetical protein JCM10213_005257 [Rhodosporidiobolus nylandii]
MLDRLPVELLEHILRFAAPLDYTPELYKERRATLKRFCLVSRGLRAAAQPMLPEVVLVDGAKDVGALETGGRGRQIKLLVYQRPFVEKLADDAHSLQRTLAACPLVRDLRFFDVDLNLKLLEPLRELRRVAFFDSCVHLTDAATVLPKVEELSIEFTAMDPGDLRLMLRSHCLPALRSFAVTSLGPEDERAFSAALSAGFFDTIKLILSAEEISELPSSFPYPDPSLVLLTMITVPAPSDFTPPFKPIHLALCPRVTLEDTVDEPELLVAIRSFLPALSQHSTIRNLGVPDFLHPSHALSGELASLRIELLKACTDNKVRIVWTAARSLWDSMVLPEFRAVLVEEAASRGQETEQKE